MATRARILVAKGIKPDLKVSPSRLQNWMPVHRTEKMREREREREGGGGERNRKESGKGEVN